MLELDNDACPFLEWLESLDSKMRFRIKARLARVSLGNFGDYKNLGQGLSELRFAFGAGYRIYFTEEKESIVLLLTGGDKHSQKKDIKVARSYLKDYLEGLKND